MNLIPSICFPFLCFPFVALAAFSCAPQSEDILDGKLSNNGLTINHQSLDLLSTDRLGSENDQYLLNEDSFGELLNSSGGADLLSYIANCALEEDQVLEVSSTGQRFSGNLGLAPKWTSTSCGQSCQRWISACLLAHSNAFGTEVAISPRAAHKALYWNQAIESRYSYQEAAFYGNVFLPSGQRVMQACAGIGLYESGPPEGEVMDQGQWLAGRICGVGSCEFVFAGVCQETLISGLPDTLGRNVCSGYTDGYFSNCSEVDEQSEPIGGVYTEVITVFLE